ncbi:Fic family protein [Oceanivirga salmonicida]|uniref:Fic family protein n=1 Tax=Oceanivirga salmonicida TaxID=1769291 RepID=UPI000835F93D|nr:Fic family protein [Oceanivirga salmonicida]
MKTFDYKKLKTLKWDNEILSLIAKIHEYKGRQELFLKIKPNILNKLVEIAKIQSIDASNKIEGIITTNSRMIKLVQEKTTPRNKDEEEILGYRDVLNTIHENYKYIPIKSSLILQLHRDLYKYSSKSIGGKFKNSQNYIIETLNDGTVIEKFKPLEAYETPGAIESICENINMMINDGEIESLILIPIFIHDFLCIHPFNDGNGRMSRLLTTLLLYKEGYIVGKYISLENKIEKTKFNYYDALEKSGKNWHDSNEDLTPFIKYILSIIISAYRDFENRVDYVDEKIPALEQVRNAFDNNIGKLTKHEIMELTPQIGKTSVENSLRKLIKENYIVRFGKGKATYYIKKN